MINKIEGFYDLSKGKETILDKDLYLFSKEHNVPVEIALLMQIIRELKKKK